MNTMENWARKLLIPSLHFIYCFSFLQIQILIHNHSRISALFVILIVSSAATFFPVVAAKVTWVKINIYVYLFARYFGAGVIIATAFIQ